MDSNFEKIIEDLNQNLKKNLDELNLIHEGQIKNELYDKFDDNRIVIEGEIGGRRSMPIKDFIRNDETIISEYAWEYYKYEGECGKYCNLIVTDKSLIYVCSSSKELTEDCEICKYIISEIVFMKTYHFNYDEETKRKAYSVIAFYYKGGFHSVMDFAFDFNENDEVYESVLKTLFTCWPINIGNV